MLHPGGRRGGGGGEGRGRGRKRGGGQGIKYKKSTKEEQTISDITRLSVWPNSTNYYCIYMLERKEQQSGRLRRRK